MTDNELLHSVEEYLARAGLSPTRFGRIVVHDPRFVFDLRLGRRPRRRVHGKVMAYLVAHGAPHVSSIAFHRKPPNDHADKTFRT